MQTKTRQQFPKAFILYAVTKSGRNGYVRFRGSVTESGSVKLSTHVVSQKSDASRYIGFDNGKTNGRRIMNECGFLQIEMIEVQSGHRTVLKPIAVR